jgi:hypothetical protein
MADYSITGETNDENHRPTKLSFQERKEGRQYALKKRLHGRIRGPWRRKGRAVSICRRNLDPEAITGVSASVINPSKARYLRWKVSRNAHILQICAAFEPLSALFSGLIQIFQTGACMYSGRFSDFPAPSSAFPFQLLRNSGQMLNGVPGLAGQDHSGGSASDFHGVPF